MDAATSFRWPDSDRRSESSKLVLLLLAEWKEYLSDDERFLAGPFRADFGDGIIFVLLLSMAVFAMLDGSCRPSMVVGLLFVVASTGSV